MAKSRTVYSYLDKGLQLNIKNYACHFAPGNAWYGSASWTDGSSIRIRISFKSLTPIITLEYTCDARVYTYEISTVALPSNLGKGNVWYFICPVSGRKCRILYFVQKMFVHRLAYPGQHYYHQCDSKTARPLNCLVPKEERAIAKLKPETVRMYYAGWFTKRYLKIIKTRQKYNQIYDNLYRELTGNDLPNNTV